MVVAWPSARCSLVAVALVAVVVGVLVISVGSVSPAAVSAVAPDLDGVDDLANTMAAAAAAAAIVRAPKAKHTASLIFLHGLGDQGYGWAEMFGELQPPHCKFIFPNAASRPVSLNGGFSMPAWFDLYGLSPTGPEDADGIKKAAKELHEIIEAEHSAGIPYDRIVVGGFSQGGATALFSGLTFDKPLGGVLALSSWVPIRDQFAEMGTAAAKEHTPVAMHHGQSDPVVPYAFGQLSHKLLQELGFQATLDSYAGLVHSSSPQEMANVAAWLKARLPAA
eukprot:m.119153 g.119153  ORF g.119153 m.119153 type:complete len:279 (-) comp16454_c0_seq2:252-1088(-)